MDGYYQFIIPNVVGVVVGLNEGPDEGVGYDEIEHGVSFINGVAQVIESGVKVGQAFGFTPFVDVWKIERRGTTVRYIRNDVVFYESLVPSVGDVFLDTSLYMGGDAVLDAKLVLYSEILPQPFSGLAGLGWEGAEQSGGRARFAAVSAEGLCSDPNVAIFSALTGLGGDGNGGQYARFAGLSSVRASENAPEMTPNYAVQNAAFAGLSGGLQQGRAIPVGRQREAPFSGFRGLGGEGGGNLQYSPFSGYRGVGGTQDLSNVPLQTTVYIAGVFEASLAQIAPPAETAPLETPLLVTTIFTAELLGAGGLVQPLRVEGFFRINADYTASIVERLVIRGFFDDPDRGAYSVWRVNMDTNASSRYRGYGFNSFANFDGRYFGAKADGLYLLNGVDDAGVPIHAAVNFGKQGFSIREQKHVPSVYLGIASNGRMVLKVQEGDSGRTFFYAARSASPHVQKQRVDLGRGLRANWFEFELLNAHGCDFDLTSVEFMLVPVGRRL
jgi:hypothetical protein